MLNTSQSQKIHLSQSDQSLAFKALDTLFHSQDFVWVTDDITRACISIPLAEAKRWVGRKALNGIFLAGNPAVAPGIARSNSAAVPRTFLIEFDKYPKGHPQEGQAIPLKEQEDIMEASGIPWTTKIFSGGKSFHYLISLKEPVDVKTFSQKFYWMSQRLQKMNDQACGDPGRWSRFPGGFRGELEQRVVEVRSPVGIQQLPGANGFSQEVMKKDAVLFHAWGDRRKDEDRTEIIEMLHWYCGEHGVEYTPNGVDLPCPACRAEGGDSHGDNFRIFGDELIAKCWAGDKTHSRDALSLIAKEWYEEVAYSRVRNVDLKIAYPNRNIQSLTKMWRNL